MIYDDKQGQPPPIAATNVSMVETEKYVDAGLCHTADTLEELAGKIGVPAENLLATVERFNAMAATTSTRISVAATRRTTGRYRRRPGADPDRAGSVPRCRVRHLRSRHQGRSAYRHRAARVLDTSGNPIPGLYSAGNTMAAPSGTTYPGGGNPIGTSMLVPHRRDEHRRK